MSDTNFARLKMFNLIIGALARNERHSTSTELYSTVQYSGVQFRTLHYGTVQYSTITVWS